MLAAAVAIGTLLRIEHIGRVGDDHVELPVHIP